MPFSEGLIRNRIGEVVTTKDGLNCTYTEYVVNDKIKVHFDDGYEKTVCYTNFKKGIVEHPNKTKYHRRVGEKHRMINGLEATIIKYDGCENIVARFENDIEVKCRYGHFKRGLVACPGVNPQFKDRTGETRIMNNGEKATIVKYNSSDDIIVRSDKGVETKTQYAAFERGYVLFPGTKSSMLKNRVGEVSRQKSGLTATVIKYNGAFDVDVQFDDPHNTIINTRYDLFFKGYLKCPLIIDKYEDEYGIGVKVTNPNVHNCWWIMDEEDLHILGDRLWHKGGGGYIVGSVYIPFLDTQISHTFNLHRLVMNTFDESVLIDHENGNRVDNRKANLRICTRAENGQNRGKSPLNTTGYKGVTKVKRTTGPDRYVSTIVADNQSIRCGTYNTPETAAYAYNLAALKYHERFANLNAIPFEHLVASEFAGYCNNVNKYSPYNQVHDDYIITDQRFLPDEIMELYKC